MCTAVSFLTKDHYFGRNLDLSYHYQESVTIMPRNIPLHFRCTGAINSHYAIIGMATVDEGYPLYYDAANEHGLSMAGLSFPDNAAYPPPSDCAVNLAPFELIPWTLCQCKNAEEACTLLKDVRIADIPYNEQYAVTPLHWMIADKTKSIVVEQTISQLNIYDNPIGILTNNPPFPYHLENIKQYIHLTNTEPQQGNWCNVQPLSFGTGAIGLPGDFSSPSRFIRAAFMKEHAIRKDSENESVTQFFHILQSVQQPEGCIQLDNGYHKTVYSSCCNTDRGIYYYTTYENPQITAIDLHRSDLNSTKLTAYPIRQTPQLYYEN